MRGQKLDCFEDKVGSIATGVRYGRRFFVAASWDAVGVGVVKLSDRKGGRKDNQLGARRG